MSFLDGIRATTHGQSRRIAIGIAMGGVVAAAAVFHARGETAADAPEPRAAAAAATASDAASGVVRTVASTTPAAVTASAAGPDQGRAGGVPASPVAADSAVASDSAGVPAALLGREAFAYRGQGRRDPFASLLKAGGDLRPLITDLRLVGVLVGTEGGNSVAIMRDLATKEQYRRRTGEALGRMRIARIESRQVVFTIEEFGYSRQEVLTYGDSTTMRTK
jgi:hypothetical protein